MAFTNEYGSRRLVLVVEDQEINRDVLGLILEDDYEIIYAENGQEALERIREHLQELSIILLDLNMPVMDGFEVLEYVRNSPDMHTIPIIVLTADRHAELKALQMGAADFITKPFDMHEIILARVARIIELSEGRHLIRVAEKDPLTGLYNRAFFFEYADQLVRFHPNWQMDAIVLDIEQFHAFNDMNGRDAGDKVLRILGQEILSFLSGVNGIGCRLEADHFFIYCSRQEDYPSILSRFQEALDKLSDKDRLRLRMGVNPWKKGFVPVLQFEQAIRACNKVRNNYKTHLMIYDEEMRVKELFYERLLNDVHKAVEEHQFIVYYQPKYQIQYDPPRLSSAEALVRWKHPELGMISPGDFIPLFEKHGLIEVVDKFVWRESARQIARWRDEFNFTFPLSVNLSRADLFDPQLEEYFLELIREFNLSPEVLKLEVTESAYTDDADQVISVVEGLRSHGFEIEMDDFGSGYSSLNMISRLPIDVLKMDMKFIQNVRLDNQEFRLVELILDIAKYLNVPVVAEGVETREQLELLRDASCDLVQGFYFSKPLPAEEFADKLFPQKTNN